MSITKDQVVSFHYTVSGADEVVLDSSEGREPMPYLHGHGGIIPGLEQQMEGRAAGDKFKTTIEPMLAYGERHEGLIQVVERDQFPEGMALEVGMNFTAETNMGPQPVVITAVDTDKVTVDGNHPLAGQTLTFDVEIAEVRDATAEELEHGHVHAGGSCES